MKYYSSGEFARMAGVTIRTIRYYDKQNILKPSFVKETGARFYTDDDFAKLQQILLLKYLDFSLEEIKEFTVPDADPKFLQNSLKIQKQLIHEKIRKMQLVEQTISDTEAALSENQRIDWEQFRHLINLTSMEQSFHDQYRNASNLTARIQLHQNFSKNQQGWYAWVFEQLKIRPGMRILEVGCGDGSLWKQNLTKLRLIPGNVRIVLSDISDGMLGEVQNDLGIESGRFSYQQFPCEALPYENETFDLVIANHVLFYSEDLSCACREAARVLKKGGRFVCSTYGKAHMHEITELVQQFDERIRLSSGNLYDVFGKENGESVLQKEFSSIDWMGYQDSLFITEAEPLISYILSCHGNQGQYIAERYKEFHSYISGYVKKGFFVTKDAGIFNCKK